VDVGSFRDLFANKSLDALVERARKRFQAGELEATLDLIERGLERFPDAVVLRDLGHQTRRAQARAAIQALMARVDQGGDAAAFEELIALYRDVGMPEERLRLTERYVREHPESEAAHLLRGEQALDAFFDDLRTRDGRLAVDHLVRAALLSPDSVKPRLLLAEIYNAIGADRALHGQADALERLSGDDDVLASAIAGMREGVPAPAGRPEAVDALLARVEVSGTLVRDPSAWSARRRRGMGAEQDGDRLGVALAKVVAEGHALETVAIDRSGTVLAASGGPDGASPVADDATPVEAEPTALADIARAVARTVKAQVRELELGRFRRCVIEGPFGVMVVEDANGGVVAATGRRGTDATRLADRLSVAADGNRGRRAS
jgi:hypothetical protein